MSTLTASTTMAYSIFEDVQGTKLKPMTGTWDDIVRLLESHPEHPNKNSCPLLKLATFGDVRSDKGGLRTDKNMLAITGVEGDYDGEKVSPVEAAARLKTAGVEACIYTTASHTHEKPRWRVLAPLSRCHAPSEREGLVALLNGALGGILAVESFTLSQSYFFGKVTGVEYETHRTQGLPLDYLDLFVEPIGKGRAALIGQGDVESLAIEVRVSDEELIRQISSGENYHAALLSLSARYYGRGMNARAIVETLQGVMRAHCDNSPRWKDRFDDIPRMVSGAVQKFQVPTQQADFQLLTADDLAKRPFTSWCIKGVLPQAGLAAIYGPSGSGKSFLVIDMAMSLSSGCLWFKLRTKKCPVVYCALEGEGGVAQRVAAYRAQHGHVGEDMRFLLQPFNLLSSDVEALAKVIVDTGCGGGVTILDTLNSAAPDTDENDSKDMGRIIAASKRLQVLIGGLVILVHHTGKDLAKGLRGHSSLLAALDCAIEISRGGDVRSWCVTKSKDGLDGTANLFRLDVVGLGKDENGDPITSCVISPDFDGGSKVHQVKVPKGGNQRIIWQAIRECLQTDSPFESENWPKSAPPGRPCIELEDAIVKTRDRLTCAKDQRTRSTRTAINALVNSGLFELKEGWLWEP